MCYLKSKWFQFTVGLFMFVMGVFLFTKNVIVYSSEISEYLFFISIDFNINWIFIPFIVGLIWIYRSRVSFRAKVFTAFGAGIILLSVSMSDLTLKPISLEGWIFLILLMFGGVMLLAKVLSELIKENRSDLSLLNQNETDLK